MRSKPSLKPMIAAFAIGVFSIACILSCFQCAGAQGYGAPGTTTLRDPLIPGASWSGPGMAAPTGAAPPIGSGPAAPLLMPGDQGNSNPPPSGTADPTTGSNFGTQPEQWEAPREVDTGADPPTIAHQSSPPFAGNSFPGPLPTVRTFCRYLVIAGVVIACFFMIMAAYAYTWGHEKAAGRVVGTAGGLIFLLMGYTIWKLVYMYICGGEPNGPWDQITKMPPRTLVNLQPANTPVVPGNGNTGAPRSNMKIVPLGGSINR